MSPQNWLAKKLLRQHHRAARAQHAARRDHAADGVTERQAIIETILDGCIHQAGEPATPIQDPAMADIGGLRQPRGAGRVDQQRAVIDADVTTFGSG